MLTSSFFFFFFNDTATTEIYTLSLHDALPISLNAEGRKVADAWDPLKDEAEGNQCKAYGAPAIMRVPGRLHITWQDDYTLKIETDAGRQTRLFNFRGGSAGSGGEWQGISTADWEVVA